MYCLSLAISLISLLLGGEKADILFAGDAMQHKSQIEAARNADGSYSYQGCFDSVSKYIQDADFAVVNLEAPLAGEPYTGYPSFSAPASFADALRDAGFDLFLTANNHCLDKGNRGLLRTLDALDQKKISRIGTYRNAVERDSILPMIKEINGFKVAFLNYTYGTNGITASGNIIVDYIDQKKISSDMRSARASGAEMIVVTIHWGIEYKLYPGSAQTKLADFLIDQGADMIIGCHPHVIQPMEIRHVDKYDKDVLLVYSLGNFISGMKTRDTRGGAMVKASIKRDLQGKAVLDKASYRLVFTIPAGNGAKNYRTVPVEEVNDKSWSSACNEFVSSAEGVFKKSNICVPRDTVPITVPCAACE